MRGIDKINRQIEIANFIQHHNINLIGILESKLTRDGLGALYLRVFPHWCFASNFNWHKGGKIVVAWKSEDMLVDIFSCSS